MGFARAQPILPRSRATAPTRTIIGERLEQERNPRVVARVMAPGYSGDGSMRRSTFEGSLTMKVLSGLRAGLLAIAALAGAVSVANADDGTIRIRIFKAGFIIGGSAGEGVLTYQGRSYPLSIGGLSYGFTFGASETRFHGTVSNIHRPSDVNGVYAQGGAGAAAGRGAQAIVLTNQNGAVLALSGEQEGLIVSLDLSGLALSLK
jgi:hypothetical protein